MHLVFALYSICAVCVFVLYIPIYALRKKLSWESCKQRLGFIPITYSKQPRIWVHAVSVGEVHTASPLIEALTQTYQLECILSATTISGYSAAFKKYAGKMRVLFCPFDIPFVTARVVRRINPALFIALETELWPALFYSLACQGTIIAVLNGRISNSAYARYMKARCIPRGCLQFIDVIGAQNDVYRGRFIALGARSEIVHTTGNLKFTASSIDKSRLEEYARSFKRVVDTSKYCVVIAASTHHPEEEILLRVIGKIRKMHPHVKLIIAPRHIERAPEVAALAVRAGYDTTFADTLRSADVYCVRTIGELLYWYALSDVCFVGGSLSHKGGQNILEPIFLNKPTVFGPSMHNFTDIAARVLAHSAGVQVHNEADLEETLKELILSPKQRYALSENCRAVFAAEGDACRRSLQILAAVYPPGQHTKERPCSS